jgi:MFS family permease
VAYSSKSQKTLNIGRRVIKMKDVGDTHTNILHLSKIHGEIARLADGYLTLDMDQMIDFVGAEGRYQYFIIFQAAVMSISMAMILYSTSFILADPDFFCSGRSRPSCSENEWCLQFPDPASWNETNIDWKYNSWVKEYGLVCGDSGSRGAYRQVIMFIAAAVYIIVSSLSDPYGRVFVFRMSTVIIFALALASYFIDDVTVKVVATGLMTAEEGILCGLFTIIINESCRSDSPLRTKGISFYFCVFALGGVVLSGLTYVVKDSNLLFLIILICSAVSAIPSFIYVHEPPKQLFKLGKVSQLFRVLTKIAHFNGQKDLTTKDIQEHFEFSDIDLETSKIVLETKTTFAQKWTLFKAQIKVIFGSTLVKYLIGYFMICVSVYICFNGVTYNSGEIGLASVQLDVIFLASVEAFCYILCIWIVSAYGRKTLTFWCFMIMIVGGAALLTIGYLPRFGNDDLTQTLITCLLIKGGLSVEYVVIFTWGSELFPSNVRGTAMGLALTGAKFMALLSTNLITFSKDVLHTNPMVGCAMTVVVSLPFLMCLPETRLLKME